MRHGAHETIIQVRAEPVSFTHRRLKFDVGFAGADPVSTKLYLLFVGVVPVSLVRGRPAQKYRSAA
jgi:hypothetical protein